MFHERNAASLVWHANFRLRTKKVLFQFKLSLFLSFLSKTKAHENSLLNAVTTLIGATEAAEREKAVEYLRGIIIKKHPEFDNNDMHDAQEFLLILLHNLAVRSNDLSFFGNVIFRKNQPS